MGSITGWERDDPETLEVYHLYREYRKQGWRTETLIRVQARNLGIHPRTLGYRFAALGEQVEQSA